MGRQWNQLWLTTAEGGEAFPLTYGDFDATSPRWSPDGRRIAYVSNEGGNTSLWTIDVPGGARRSWRCASADHLRPTGRLDLVVSDPTGAKLPARISVTGADGRAYAPDDAPRPCRRPLRPRRSGPSSTPTSTAAAVAASPCPRAGRRSRSPVAWSWRPCGGWSRSGGGVHGPPGTAPRAHRRSRRAWLAQRRHARAHELRRPLSPGASRSPAAPGRGRRPGPGLQPHREQGAARTRRGVLLGPARPRLHRETTSSCTARSTTRASGATWASWA